MKNQRPKVTLMKGMNRMNKETTEKELQETPEQEAFSWSGLACIGFIFLMVTGWFLIPALVRARESGHPPNVSNYLKQWGLIYKMYANESPGKQYPPLTNHDGLWVPDLKTIYPEYLTDEDIVIAPENWINDYATLHEELYDKTYLHNQVDIDKLTQIMAQSYVYAGWVVYEDTDVEFMKRFRTTEGMHIGDIETEEASSYWIREGVERFFITDINNPGASAMEQSKIPLMVARPGPEKYYGRGCAGFFNKHFLDKPKPLFVPVLYLDGHVESIPLEKAPDHIKALVELFPEPMEEE